MRDVWAYSRLDNDYPIIREIMARTWIRCSDMILVHLKRLGTICMYCTESVDVS
jgi:hypothetical protein